MEYIDPVLSIEDSFEKCERYPTVVERYYTQYYFTPRELPPDETHCILLHSNRICLITLAQCHPVIKGKKIIENIDFKISDKVDRAVNKVRGKGKKGAQIIAPSSHLCFIKCTDGTQYKVFGCIKGKLIEINENILKNPQVLVEKPLSDGFIAIILPGLKDVEQQKSSLTLYKPCLANKSDLGDVDDD